MKTSWIALVLLAFLAAAVASIASHGRPPDGGRGERGTPAGAEPEGRIFGSVVGPDGEPMERALVHAAMTPPAPGLKAGSAGLAHTGADGRFEIEGLAAATFTVTVQAHPLPSRAVAGIEVAAGATVGPLEIRLETAQVSGRVLAPDGTPAVGVAVVVLTDWRVASLGPEPATSTPRINSRYPYQARTDGRGAFAVPAPSLGPVVVVAESDPLGDAAIDLEVRGGDNPIELRLDPGGRVLGRVVDSKGDSVPVATVGLARASAPAEAVLHGSQMKGHELVAWRQCIGSDGRFLFRRLAPGEYQLEATAQNLRQTGGPQLVTVGEEPVPDVVLALATGVEIHGRLSGLPAGVPLPEMIGAEGPGPEYRGATIDGDGRYRIAGLAAGRWQLTVYGAPHGRQVQGVVEITEGGGPYRLDFDLGGGLTVSGRVKVSGEPLVDGHVELSRRFDQFLTGVSTEGDGSFRVEGLEPGEYGLRITGAQGELLGSRRLELTADRTLELVLATASLEGRLLDPTGLPVSGGEVWLHEAGSDSDTIAARAQVDASGRYRVPQVAPGAYQVRSYLAGRTAREVVTLEPGSRRELDLRFEPGSDLVLIPTLASGGRPERIEIRIEESLLKPVYSESATVSASGTATFAGVPAGRWTAVVAAEGAALVDVEFTAPTAPVAVTLPPATVLLIEVPDQERVLHVPLVITGADGSIPAAGRTILGRSLLRGRSRIDRLPPGTWKVSVATADGRRYEGTATTAPGEPAKLILE